MAQHAEFPFQRLHGEEVAGGGMWYVEQDDVRARLWEAKPGQWQAAVTSPGGEQRDYELGKARGPYMALRKLNNAVTTEARLGQVVDEVESTYRKVLDEDEARHIGALDEQHQGALDEATARTDPVLKEHGEQSLGALEEDRVRHGGGQVNQVGERLVTDLYKIDTMTEEQHKAMVAELTDKYVDGYGIVGEWRDYETQTDVHLVQREGVFTVIEAHAGIDWQETDLDTTDWRDAMYKTQDMFVESIQEDRESLGIEPRAWTWDELRQPVENDLDPRTWADEGFDFMNETELAEDEDLGYRY